MCLADIFIVHSKACLIYDRKQLSLLPIPTLF